MTHADRFWMRGELLELSIDQFRLQVDPAHHAAYHLRMRVRQTQQEVAFGQALTGVDRDRTVEPGLLQQRREVVRQEVPPERPISLDPRIVRGVVAPEVLMAV